MRHQLKLTTVYGGDASTPNRSPNAIDPRYHFSESLISTLKGYWDRGLGVNLKDQLLTTNESCGIGTSHSDDGGRQVLITPIDVKLSRSSRDLDHSMYERQVHLSEEVFLVNRTIRGIKNSQTQGRGVDRIVLTVRQGDRNTLNCVSPDDNRIKLYDGKRLQT